MNAPTLFAARDDASEDGGGAQNGARASDADVGRALVRVRTAVTRAAAVGAVLRGGLTLGKLALGRRRTQTSEALTRATMEIGRYVAFFSAFAGTYVAVDETLRAKFGAEESKRWRAAFAGACAGPSLMLIGGNTTHYGLAGYIWVRSLVLLARVAQKSENEKVQNMAAFTKVEHGDVALMVGSAAVILSCFVLKPEAVEPGYLHFLKVQAGKTPEELLALQKFGTGASDAELRAVCARLAVSNMWSAGNSAQERANKTAVSAVSASTGVINRVELFRLICFQGASNPEHFFKHIAKSFSTTLSVYLPVYLVPALMIHRGKLLSPERGPKVLSRIITGSGRSALFLSSYVACGWSGIDIANRALGTADWRSIPLGVASAGLATFIEKKSRRMELAMYCLSRAFETTALVAVYQGLVPKCIQRQRCDVALFSVATATIMHCYNTERDVFRSKYLNMLDFLFGSAGHHKQTISHAASYEILFDAPDRFENAPADGRFHKRESSLTESVSEEVSERDFNAASEEAKDLLGMASVPEILALYSYYKQATKGDCDARARPGIFDQQGRAKFDAWHSRAGMSKQDAMSAYIDRVELLKKARVAHSPASSSTR
jgi:acyl-CoA-binding protein